MCVIQYILVTFLPVFVDFKIKTQLFMIQDEEDQYIDEDQSAYIGKARFKPNSLAKERALPSKAQVVNLIKLVKRKDEGTNEINRKIIEDLEEALNVDLQEKQFAVAQGWCRNSEILKNPSYTLVVFVRWPSS